MTNKLKIFDYEITTMRFPFNITDNANIITINTINAYSYQIAKTDNHFKKALQDSDYLIPDGVGFKLAAKILNNIVIDKYSGYELHADVLKYLDKKSGRCFYFGSTNKTLDLITKRINSEYKNVKVGHLSPPFSDQFTESDNNKFIERINSFNPDVLFVGLAAPKQEKWAYANKNTIKAKYVCSIGAVFDFYAGTVRKPNQILVKIGLEWLSRLINDPKHMLRRYKRFPITTFIYDILKHKKQSLCK